MGQFRGNSHLVLYFYPKDDALGCTLEAIEFTDLQPEFTALDTQVLGISKDSCGSHGAFRDKDGINVRLPADTEGEVCDAYGVWREKDARGEKHMGIVRSTFYDIKPKGHAARILELVRGL